MSSSEENKNTLTADNINQDKILYASHEGETASGTVGGKAINLSVNIIYSIAAVIFLYTGCAFIHKIIASINVAADDGDVPTRTDSGLMSFIIRYLGYVLLPFPGWLQSIFSRISNFLGTSVSALVSYVVDTGRNVISYPGAVVTSIRGAVYTAGSLFVSVAKCCAIFLAIIVVMAILILIFVILK